MAGNRVGKTMAAGTEIARAAGWAAVEADPVWRAAVAAQCKEIG
jgi:hypothetical protein